MKTQPSRLSHINFPFKTYRGKLRCTAVLLTLPTNLVWIMFLAAAIIVSHLTSVNGATGSFDRESYFPSYGDTNDFDRAWLSVTDSSGNTTSSQDTITVTVKAGSNSTSFVLKETGSTTTVFTTMGNTQPSQTGIGAKTGYVEDYSGSHNFPALGTSIVGLNLKELVANTGGDASTGSDASLTVSSGNTLLLVYGGSTLDTALVKTNSGSFSFTPSSVTAVTTNSLSNANLIISITDQDENINPLIKDVIGFQDGFSLGLTNTGSYRVQIEAIDQTTGSLLNLNGVNVITRNIALVETGRSTGIFEASGKVYGANTVTATGNITVGSQKGYSGDFIELGSPSFAPYVKFRVIETNAATGSLGLFYSGTSTYASVERLETRG